MYSSSHTSLGVSILMITGLTPLGCALAFGSHFVLDIIQEHPYRTILETKIKESVGLFIQALVVFTIGVMTLEPITATTLFVAGAFFANLPDLWDKLVMLGLFKKPQIMPCHQKYWPSWYPSIKMGTKIIPYALFAMLMVTCILRVIEL